MELNYLRGGEASREASSMSDGTSKPKKQRRISRACDFCHRRSIRCRPTGDGDNRCQNCSDFSVDCTFDRPFKRRGTRLKPLSHDLAPNHARSLSLPESPEVDRREQPYNTSRESAETRLELKFSFDLREDHQALVLSNIAKVQDLITVYFEVVYPIFPLFHRPTLLRKISTREYLCDKAHFAMIMAICALASARARDGALYPAKWKPSYLREPPAETFSSAAIAALPSDWSKMGGLDWMRTCAVLALVGIQFGNIKMMHQYLGTYHTLVAMDGLHDEKNWPRQIDMVQVEERRRLFWSIYTLEIYSSIVWGGMIRCRETQSRVLYPSELDDEMFSQTSISDLPSSPGTQQFSSFAKPAITDTSCWLHGWNFTTDLYRILEHAMDVHRLRRQNIGPFSPSDLFQQSAPPQSVVLDKIFLMHENLPSRFKETRGVVGETTADRYSFQAANIAATLQLARMVLFTAEDATVDQKCAIARELLDDFTKIPLFFLKAISSPLLHHLAGIGAVLGSVIEGQLSLSEYFQVRTVLLAMADLLASLEASLTHKAGASERLRALLSRIDEYMSSQRLQELPVPMTEIRNQQQQVEWPASTQIDYGQMSEMDMQLSFQLPQELLEDWPWPLDLTQGFGNFAGA